MNIPNAMSLFRLVLLPFFFYFYLVEKSIPWTIGVLALSGLSDVLDGIIARKFNMVTDLGKLLDPLCDKITQMAIAIAVCITRPILIYLIGIFIIKEILMLSGSLKLLRNGKRPCEAKWYGKLATVAFYAAMLVIFLLGDKDQYVWIQIVLVSIVTLLMINAFVRYSKIFKDIQQQDKKKQALPIAAEAESVE